MYEKIQTKLNLVSRNFLMTVLLVHIAVVFASESPSQGEDKSLDRCREMTRAVMRQVVAGNDRGALDLLRLELPIDKMQFEALRDRTIAQREAFGQKYGKILGFKLVREERVSDFLVRMTYVEKRVNHLVRWQFTFYRAAAEWKLNIFIWDDDISKLFGHSPKRSWLALERAAYYVNSKRFDCPYKVAIDVVRETSDRYNSLAYFTYPRTAPSGLNQINFNASMVPLRSQWSEIHVADGFEPRLPEGVAILRGRNQVSPRIPLALNGKLLV